MDIIDSIKTDVYKNGVTEEEKISDLENTGIITPNQRVTWKTINMHRTDALKMTTILGLKMQQRDYSNAEGSKEAQDLKIPFLRALNFEQSKESFPSAPDRSRDSFEDTYRRLYAGDLGKSVHSRKLEFDRYYAKLGELNEINNRYSGVIIMIVSVIIWLFLVFYFWWIIRSMKQFWEKFLKIDVKFLIFFF